MSNSNNDQKPGLAVGFILGFAVCMVLFNLPFADHYKAQKAIEECQKNLSRNQYCHITAQPNEPSTSNSSN